ncbi:gliding motility-associated C-terminal domain-containing protein [Flammeovirgaceae bacterium SG7u.111]|nr:gliding motility-associated C-terminal domain-containing protein [Flammeovirgaceae bacterium SG7u.132]WPO35483.1 gliding motility-associated C-terminal domain-containing protein [Flammeovirgaceae bacterium SG7u.111]
MNKKVFTNKLQLVELAVVKKILLLPLLLVLLATSHSSFAQGACNDRESLVALYNATDGASWKTTWDLNTPITEWFGVEVNADTCVISIRLTDNGLTGSIPPEIDSLSLLEDLFLDKNNLSDTIPNMGNLTNLQRLNLSENELSGPIPATLGSLANLREMNLSSNDLSGEIPASLGSLSALEVLNLSRNNLSGEIPSSFGGLSNLRTLDLRDNSLGGELPEELRNLANLETLNLSRNLYDELPDDLDTYTNIDNIIIINNQLTFEDLLPNNVLNTGLAYAPQDSIGEARTVFLNPGENYTIDLGFDATVEGNVYTWFKDGVEIVGAPNENKLPINDAQEADEGIYTVVVTNLSAPTLTLNTRPVEIIVTDLSCRVDDSLALVTLYNSTNGGNWVETWNLDTLMSTWHGVSTNALGCVDELDLTGNNLNGEVPAELGSIVSLERLVLADNVLSGEIPSELGDLVNLRVLKMENNTLSDTIPEELGKLFMLDTLSLFNNQLEGNFPKEFGKLASLTVLWLDQNQLDDELPEEIGDMTSLVDLSLSNNAFSGTIPAEIAELDSLYSLNLSNNQISNVPPEIADMDNLVELFLTSNSLSGDVPVEFTQMDSLRVLLLNENQFTGLPDMESLDSVIVFIQDNQLTFEDFLPDNIKYFDIGEDQYSPQDSVGPGGSVNLDIGDDYTIDLEIDPFITTSSYKWFKDGVEIMVLNVNTFDLTDVQAEDAGLYWAEITNPDVPGLVLYSRPVEIIIGDPVSIIGSDIACMGDTVTYSAEPIDGSFIWEVVGGTILGETTDNPVRIVWTKDGAALVRVTDTSSGFTDETPVTLGPDLGAPEVSYQPVIKLGNPPTPLVASGSEPGVIIKWYSDSTLTDSLFTGEVYPPDFDTSMPGVITYYVTQEFAGCISPPTEVTIEVRLVKPDLVISSASITPGQITSRGTVQAQAAVLNISDEVAQPTTMRVYLSADTVLGADDIEVSSQDISSLDLNDEDSKFFALTVPVDTEPGTYFLIFVADADGEVDEEDETNNTAIVTLTIIDSDVELTIMNVITPNADGMNEVLYIENIEFFPDGEVTILNKWGFEVFKTSGYQNDWNAVDFSGKPLPPGNYICIVKFNESGKEPLREIVAVIRP